MAPRKDSALKVVFRCDASAAIGGGHVVRCLALAEALHRRGADITFAVSTETPVIVEELHRTPYRIERGFQIGKDGASRLDALRTFAADLIIVDHYGLDKSYETSTRSVAKMVVAIDDAPGRAHDCDILLDATLGRTGSAYDGVVSLECLRICGSSYALLRSPFADRRIDVKPPRTENATILVSLGMTDSANVTSTALRALDGLRSVTRVVAVLGSKAPHIAEVRSLAEKSPAMTVETDADAQKMATLMSECDIVIGAPGSASYERCCLGRPSVLVQIADNQTSNALAIVEAGAASLVGILPNISSASLRDSVSKLLMSPPQLRAMHEAALSVTDGKGADRAAEAIIGKLRSRSSSS